MILTPQEEAFLICKAGLLAKGMPKEEVEKLYPGRITDSVVQLVIMNGVPWETALACVRAIREEVLS